MHAPGILLKEPVPSSMQSETFIHDQKGKNHNRKQDSDILMFHNIAESAILIHDRITMSHPGLLPFH